MFSYDKICPMCGGTGFSDKFFLKNPSQWCTTRCEGTGRNWKREVDAVLDTNTATGTNTTSSEKKVEGNRFSNTGDTMKSKSKLQKTNRTMVLAKGLPLVMHITPELKDSTFRLEVYLKTILITSNGSGNIYVDLLDNGHMLHQFIFTTDKYVSGCSVNLHGLPVSKSAELRICSSNTCDASISILFKEQTR